MRKTIVPLLGVLALAAVLLWLGKRWQAPSAARPAVANPADPAARGAAAFIGGDFGGISMHALETHALPWRLAAAALVLDEKRRDPAAAIDQATLNRVLARFGFLTAVRIDNLPPGVAPPSRALPLGMTYGELAPIGGARVLTANLGCAACHAGVTYAADGAPQPGVALLGAPNSSLDLERYTGAVFDAMRRHAGSDALLPAAERLFPEMDWRERQSLRWLVLPLVKRRLAALAGQDRPLPFPNGSPGATNGVAALKAALGAPLRGGGAADAGVVSIPMLTDRDWRSSLLVDGAYAPPGGARQRPMTRRDLTPQHQHALAAIATFFTVPSMGVAPERAPDALADSQDAMAYLSQLKPQAFPGAIDVAAAARGAGIYARACAACHGDYDADAALQRFPNWLGETGGDPLRARTFDAALVKAAEAAPYRRAIAVRPGGAYVAPLLSGVWASAPYLHNGSVPSLWALLTPAERPVRFQVGGHALDFARMGVAIDAQGAYRAGYRPFAQPAWIDTRAPGYGNQGHAFGAELSSAEKRDLIEFLKRL